MLKSLPLVAFPVPTAYLLSLPSSAFSDASRGSPGFPTSLKLDEEETLLDDDLPSLAVEGSIIDAAPAPRNDCDLLTPVVDEGEVKGDEEDEGVPSLFRPPLTKDKNILLILWNGPAKRTTKNE